MIKTESSDEHLYEYNRNQRYVTQKICGPVKDRQSAGFLSRFSSTDSVTEYQQIF